MDVRRVGTSHPESRQRPFGFRSKLGPLDRRPARARSPEGCARKIRQQDRATKPATKETAENRGSCAEVSARRLLEYSFVERPIRRSIGVGGRSFQRGVWNKSDRRVGLSLTRETNDGGLSQARVASP